MEQKASSSNKQIPDKANHEDQIMSLCQTVMDTFGCKVHEEEIGECIHNLCRVYRGIVILSEA